MLIIRLEKTDKYFTLLFQDISVIFSFVTHATRWSLLRPRERWRSIVIRTSICLSVCTRAYLRSHTRDLYQILCACCLWPWLGPSLAGWRNAKGKEQFWGFPPHWQCIVTRSLQKGSFNIGREGVIGVHSAGEVWYMIALWLLFSNHSKSYLTVGQFEVIITADRWGECRSCEADVLRRCTAQVE